MEKVPPSGGWEAYDRAAERLGVSPTLIEALRNLPHRTKALDLGAGAVLIDAQYLVRERFESVTAVEPRKEILETYSTLPDAIKARLHIEVRKSEEFDYPEGAYDIVNAQYSLPHIGDKSNIAEVFRKVHKALKPGGIFVGQLFGLNDAWNNGSRKMSFHSREEIEELLAAYEPEPPVVEREYDGSQADGSSKHWHVFDFSKRKSL